MLQVFLSRDQRELLVIQDLQAPLEPLALKVLQELQEIQDQLDQLVLLEIQERLAPQDQLERQELTVM